MIRVYVYAEKVTNFHSTKSNVFVSMKPFINALQELANIFQKILKSLMLSEAVELPV